MPPLYWSAPASRAEAMAGMKKLVPMTLSSSSIMALTNSAGKASRPSTVAVKIPHTDSGMRISVMPRVRAWRMVVM